MRYSSRKTRSRQHSEKPKPSALTIEAAWKSSQEAMFLEKAKLEPEVEVLQGKRDSELEGKDRAALSLYDLLRERRGGVAVAAVERGMCQGCRISLPMSSFSESAPAPASSSASAASAFC